MGNFLVCSRCTESCTTLMINGLINLTLLLFSYETKFLTSCFSKDNSCQIWVFLSERKLSVFRGQNSLSSARVSAGVIYRHARGTMGHNCCDKTLSSSVEIHVAHQYWENQKASYQAGKKCAHQRKRELALLAKVPFPIIWRVVVIHSVSLIIPSCILKCSRNTHAPVLLNFGGKSRKHVVRFGLKVQGKIRLSKIF